MPELPEVETIRQDLRAVLRGKTIARVVVRKEKMVIGSAPRLVRVLKNKKVRDIKRRAKLLIIEFANDDRVLLLHLKMTGQLIYRSKRHTIAGGHSWPALRPAKAGLPASAKRYGRAQRQAGPLDLPNQYSHIIFSFTDGSTLYFNDLRQFGYVELVGAEERRMVEHTFGIEPLTPAFTFDNFREAIDRRATAIKNVLLNQAVIAGLGNIYVDEACFYARVRPTRRADTLSHEELKNLWRGCTHVITNAIKHRGTTFNSYRDTQGRSGNYVQHLKVYGRGGLPCRRAGCRRAGAVIHKEKVAGRGTHYCPVCQV